MDGMAIFAIVFLIFTFMYCYAYACCVLNNGRDMITDALAKKLVKFIDSRNNKKKDI